jgi:hypothetical protein
MLIVLLKMSPLPLSQTKTTGCSGLIVDLSLFQTVLALGSSIVLLVVAQPYCAKYDLSEPLGEKNLTFSESEDRSIRYFLKIISSILAPVRFIDPLIN